MTIHVMPTSEAGAAALDGRPPALLELRRLTLRTREFEIGIEGLRLEQGRRIAIVGPNGSGKTTLLEALLGLRRAQCLDGALLGQPVAQWIGEPRMRKRLGVQLQQGLYPGQLTAPELVNLHAAMFDKGDAELAKALSLAELGARTYRDLSHGQRQRMNLYMALAHRPDAAFLDEPFTGLDRRTAHALSEHLSMRGPSSLLLVGHTAPELELADWIVQLRAGRVVAEESRADALQRLCGPARADIRFAAEADAGAFADEARRQAFILRVSASTPLTVACFGGHELRDYVLTAAAGKAVTDFAFAATTAEDLLRFCSEDKADA